MYPVKLISVSKPVVDNIPASSLKELVCYYARVSNPKNQATNENCDKLFKYLIDHKHWSPLEMVHLVFEIRCSREISRQILRHRSFSFQEYSQRYSTPILPNYLINTSPRTRNNKSSSSRQSSNDPLNDKNVQLQWKVKQEEIRDLSLDTYYWAIGKGIGKELARKVLPEGLTESVLYMAGTLRSFWHYVELRSGEDTQKEHREIAKEIGRIIQEQILST